VLTPTKELDPPLLPATVFEVEPAPPLPIVIE
jgi:hypothetical protein